MTDSNMTVAAVQQLRRSLEKRLLDELHNFERVTGAQIASVDIRRSYAVGIPVGSIVELHIEVGL